MGGEGGDAGEIGGGGDAGEGGEGGDAGEPPEVEEQEQEQMEEEGAWPQPPMVQPPMLDLEVDGVSIWCQHTYTCVSMYQFLWFLLEFLAESHSQSRGSLVGSAYRSWNVLTRY